MVEKFVWVINLDMHTNHQISTLDGSDLCNLWRFDDTGPTNTFMEQMEGLVPNTKRTQAMDSFFKWTHVWWWATHHTYIHEWEQVVEYIKFMFYPMTYFELMKWYKVTKYPHENICFCKRNLTTKNIPSAQWVQRIPKNFATKVSYAYNTPLENSKPPCNLST